MTEKIWPARTTEYHYALDPRRGEDALEIRIRGHTGLPEVWSIVLDEEYYQPVSITIIVSRDGKRGHDADTL